MKISVIVLVSAMLAAATDNEDLCRLCDCSIVDISFRDKFFESAIDYNENEMAEWTPIVTIPDSTGKYLAVNCVSRRIDSKWPPLRIVGVSGDFSRTGLARFPNFPEDTREKFLELSLSNNEIYELSETDLQDYQHLRNLDLSNNHIKYLKDLCFSRTRYLSKLDLSKNSINEVGKWFFRSNLSYLNLANNQISVIRSHAMEELKNLVYLDLSYNLLNSLSDNFGSSLTRLKFLHLARNQFEVVPRLPRSLITVNISSNRLQSLVLPLIDDLFVLDVSNNNLDELDNVFNQLGLKILRARYNNLTKLGEVKNSGLTVLDLGYNYFKTIPEEINSSKLPHLRELYLDGNPLSQIAFNQGNRPFPELEVLDVSNLGDLTEISHDSFSWVILESYANCSEEKGISMNLSNNKLTKIDPYTFKSFPICEIDLSRNKLTSIAEELFSWKNLTKADLQHNPWDCTCELQWMVDKYLPYFYQNQPKSLFELRCATPSRLKGRVLVYWYNTTKDVFCAGSSYYKFEYAKGKFFEIWSVSLIISIILICLIFIVLLVIIILLCKRPYKISQKKKKRSKPLFSELRIDPDHKYNPIVQENSI